MTSDPPAELALQLWLSPAFPVGAFAYSHGLEWAMEAGDVKDAATLAAWLEDLCDAGAPRNDAVLFARAHRTATTENWQELLMLNQLAVALAGSRERRLETTQQGNAFVTAASAAWDSHTLAELRAYVAEPYAYPVAVATTAAGHGIPLATALPAFGLAIFANLVSAAVRLSAIGQTDGQRVLARLLPRAAAMAEAAAGAEFAEGEAALGGSAFRSDLAAILHESQYSRLFRS